MNKTPTRTRTSTLAIISTAGLFALSVSCSAEAPDGEGDREVDGVGQADCDGARSEGTVEENTQLTHVGDESDGSGGAAICREGDECEAWEPLDSQWLVCICGDGSKCDGFDPSGGGWAFWEALCVIHAGSTDGDSYVPCGGLYCGQGCSLCDPNTDDCETKVGDVATHLCTYTGECVIALEADCFE